MKKFKAAVIGCGKISTRHLDAISALENVELVAVCDNKEEAAISTARRYGVKYYTDYEELFRNEKLDAVHICLPHYLHTLVAEKAFENGISVLCEKPMSIDFEDAVRAVRKAKEKNLKYSIVFQCRYNTPSQLVKKRIEDGRLGKVKCGNVTLTWARPDDYYDDSDWKGTWDKEGGGVIIDQAIHSLDLANWFVDSSVTDIKSSLHNRNHSRMQVEDTGEGLIRYENGAIISFFAMNNYLINEPIEIRLCCENGTVRLSYDDAIISYNDGSVETAENEPQKIVTYKDGKEYWGYQHAVQIDRFYKSLAGELPLEISGEEALKIQNIICSIYKSNDSKI
ncbi:MAG: Gfo/Idh/MocA family oxidoreductase [Clostridia bacterium]|nr:Gfo/Idh/MocA family oxidoreductase [Clostridia bacterium]